MCGEPFSHRERHEHLQKRRSRGVPDRVCAAAAAVAAAGPHECRHAVHQALRDFAAREVEHPRHRCRRRLQRPPRRYVDGARRFAHGGDSLRYRRVCRDRRRRAALHPRACLPRRGLSRSHRSRPDVRRSHDRRGRGPAAVPLRLAIIFAIALVVPAAVGAPHRLALLIGINDYTASRLTTIRAAAPDRDWPNLAGAVNDIAAMRELLVQLHGFDAGDIVTLNDQSATRSAMLSAANRLAATATKDDVVFFYFAGHGSQVRNSRSDEPDKLDESIVPADSARGAPDIRDKELRRIFNAILDRGARLTVMIDPCHSGSAARRLLTLARPRGIRPDLSDVADGGDYGPRPENRGALLISASHDDEEARETRDDQRTMHGAFTWAWMRAMRDAAPDEPAIETFTRAQARLRAEMPFQNPVLAGDAPQRRTPFLGTGNAVGAARTTFAVERVRSDGTAVISGGWAHGITAGS